MVRAGSAIYLCNEVDNGTRGKRAIYLCNEVDNGTRGKRAIYLCNEVDKRRISPNQHKEKHMEEQNTLVTLIDEQGREVEFDLVATFDYEKKRYAALIPIDEVENVDENEVVILEIVKSPDGERYLPIENDVLLDEVFNEFLEILDEMADGDDEE